MSFFGFGRSSDNDIPLASPSSSQQQRQQQDQQQHSRHSDSPPPASPHAPPPTHPAYSPSPALTSPHSNSSARSTAQIEASALPSIPDIHIFNPAVAEESANDIPNNNDQYHEEQGCNYQKDNDGAAMNTNNNEYDYGTIVEPEDEEEEADNNAAAARIHKNLSMESNISYGTAEEDHYYAQQQQQQQQDGGYYQQQQNHVNGYADDYPQHQEYQQSPATTSYDDEGYATAAQSMDTEDAPTPTHDHNNKAGTYGEYNYSVSTAATDQHQTNPSPGSTSGYVPGSARKLIETFRTPLRDRSLTVATGMADSTAKSPLHEAIFTPKFKQIHDKTIRRRQDMQHHKQDLERRLAKLTADLANNTMDREQYMAHFLRDHICRPMEQVSERIGIERDYRTSPQYAGTKHWMQFATRLSRLDRVMTLHDHVEVQTQLRDHLEAPTNELVQEIVPAFYLETAKSEKREAALVRQFDSVAATAQRRYHEERASRYASFDALKQRLLAVVKRESDPARIEEAITKVKALRAKLEQERVERRMRDEHTKTLIEQDERSMKRAALEATGGDDLIMSSLPAITAGGGEYASSSRSVRRTIAYHD